MYASRTTTGEQHRTPPRVRTCTLWYLRTSTHERDRRHSLSCLGSSYGSAANDFDYMCVIVCSATTAAARTTTASATSTPAGGTVLHKHRKVIVEAAKKDNNHAFLALSAALLL